MNQSKIWPWFCVWFHYIPLLKFNEQDVLGAGFYGQWTALSSVSGQRQRPVTALSWLSGVMPGPAQRGGNERKSAECWPYMIPGARGWWPCSNLHLRMIHESGRSETETHDWSSDERVDLRILGDPNSKQTQNASWLIQEIFKAKRRMNVNLTLLVCEIWSRNARTRR